MHSHLRPAVFPPNMLGLHHMVLQIQPSFSWLATFPGSRERLEAGLPLLTAYSCLVAYTGLWVILMFVFI